MGEILQEEAITSVAGERQWEWRTHLLSSRFLSTFLPAKDDCGNPMSFPYSLGSYT